MAGSLCSLQPLQLMFGVSSPEIRQTDLSAPYDIVCIVPAPTGVLCIKPEPGRIISYYRSLTWSTQTQRICDPFI